MKPTVSILCITYNHVRYIAETINGFLAQKVNFEIEILVGNDASTDGTAMVLDRFTSYPQIQVFNHQTNLGQRGINNLIFLWQRAQGTYLILCEGDDYWTDPLKLQKQVAFLESHPQYGGCFHNVEVLLSSNGSSVEYHPTYFKQWDITLRSPVISFDDLLRVNLGLVAPTCSLLFRNTPEILNWLKPFTIADRVIALSVSLIKGPLYYIPENWAVYRKHEGGSTARMDYDSFEKDYIQYYALADNLSNGKTKPLTRRFRFEIYQACFIEQYRQRKMNEAVRLFKQLAKTIHPFKPDEWLFFVKDAIRLLKIMTL